MKTGVLLLGLLMTSPPQSLSPAQQLAKKLIVLEQSRKQYTRGIDIIRGIKSEGQFYYVRLSTTAGPPQDISLEGYNCLEIIVSNSKITGNWPREKNDVMGKTLWLIGDYGLQDRRIETAASFENNVHKEHFFLLRKNPESMSIYDHWHTKYRQAIEKLMKTITY